MKKGYYRLLLVFLLLAMMVVSGCDKETSTLSEQNDEIKPIAVSVTEVSKTTIESFINLTGKTAPIKDISVLPKIPGKVLNVYFEVGQQVEKGDVLFSLEDSDIRLQLRQAEAGLTAAQAGLNRAKGGMMEQQLIQLESAMIAAETNYIDAKSNYDRTQQLFDAGAVSKQMLEVAESRLALANDQYEAAKSVFEITQTKINPENIAAAEAQLSQAQAAYDMARSQLDNTLVRSPIKGIVASKTVKAGEFASTAMPAMTIVDLSFLEVSVNVTEDVVNKIHVNDKAEVSIKAVGTDMFEGKIISVSPSTDQRTQTYPVKVRIQNDSGIIKGGMFCDIKLITAREEDTIVVPLSCLLNEDGKNVVYVVNNGIANKRYITTGLSNDTFMQVNDGLEEGDIVIIKGQDFIKDGSKVTITQ